MAGAQITCENDPNFGIILSFMEQFGVYLDVGELNIAELKAMLENSEAVPQALVDLHIKLMRKINKKVPAARWELALAKFAHSYSHQDAWEIERFGYKTANLGVKLRVLKALLEGQFDLNTKFKTQINTTGAADLRLDPLGRDRQGNCYWYFMDESANLQIYQSDPEMETWTLVASNRDEFVNMIEMLKDNRPIEPQVAVHTGEDEEDSGGSMSESEAMKLDTSIPAPTEIPPSLIISRRIYKTPDQLDAMATVAEEAKEPQKQETIVIGKEPIPKEEESFGNQQEANKEEKEGDVPMAHSEPELKTEPAERKNEAEANNEAMECEVETKATQEEDVREEVKMEVEEVVPAVKESTDKENDEDKQVKEDNESAKLDEGKEPEQKTSDSKSDTDAPEADKETSPAKVLTSTEESRPEMKVVESTHGEETGTTVLNEEGVSEAIEDPLVTVKGESNGADCDSAVEPIFSEVIEEPIMFFFGHGAGVENDMGNTKKIEAVAATDAKEDCAEENDSATIGPSKAGNGETKSLSEETDSPRKLSPTKESEDATEQQQDHTTKKTSLAEKPTRAKRNDKPAAVAANELTAVQVDKPVEKKRGSRKSNTPKKAYDLSVTAATLQLMEGDEGEVSKEEPAKVEPVAIVLKPPSEKGAKNGDHATDDGLKKELKQESEELDSKEELSTVSQDEKDIKGIATDTVKKEPLKEAEEKQDEEKKPTDVSKDTPQSESTKVKESEKVKGDVTPENIDTSQLQDGESPPKRKRRQKNGLVDGLDISMVLDAGSDGGNNPPVRQSRRIAMQKIKEETNRREIEDQMLKKMKADAVKKKKDLGMKISDDDYRADRTSPEHSSESSSDGGIGADGRKRKKKKKKKKGSIHQQAHQLQQLNKKQSTWNSASPSESSSETEPEDYFAEPYHSEEDVRRSHVLKSDHEFSPESDLETEAPAQPLKRARTARKARRTREEAEAAEEEEEEDEDDGGEDHACQECKKTDQPEWILLCDSCDKGYHCACLKPVLFTIPEGDWFCPVCLHRQLIERLQSKLVLYDALRIKLEAEAKRRQEEEQSAREAELAEQARANEREEQLRAQRRARQQERLLERADAVRRRSHSGSEEEESSRDRRRRRQRHRGRRAPKKRSRSRSEGDSSSNSSGDGRSSGGSGVSGSDSKSSTDSDDIPIYKLRRRASAKVSYKFNEYDSLIDSAIRREMRGCEMVEEEDDEDDEGHGFSKGKDISTIIEATTREEQARKKALQQDDSETQRLNGNQDQNQDENEPPASREDDGMCDEGEEGDTVARQDRKTTAINRTAVSSATKKPKKKKKKLCKIEISSEEEEDDDSDEDFRGEASGSEDEDEEDDEDDEEDDNSLSGESESSLDMGRGRKNRLRKPSSRAAASKRRRIVENSDDSDEVEEEMRRAKAKKSRKNRVLDDSDEELDLDDDDEEDSEDYDSDDLCSDTETESSRSSKSSNSSSSSAPSTEGDWRRKKKSKGGKAKPKAASATGGGGGKHLERPKKGDKRPKAAIESSDDSDDSEHDASGKGGKTIPGRKKQSNKKTTSRSSPDSERAGEKKSDRKTRGKKIHYIVDEDFESSDDGIRPGVQRPDTPPEEREQFIRRQEEIKRMLAENNAAKAKELATSKFDQLVGGGGRSGAKESSKDSLSDVPMQVIESARILDIDFLKSTSGNTARISTVDSVVDFDDELPEDFDPEDAMDDEVLAKIMEEEDFAHHQLKPPAGAAATASPGDLLPPVPPASKSRRKSIDPDEFLVQQRSGGPRPVDARKDQHPPLPLPVNLASSSAMPHASHPTVQSSPIKALLKSASGIPTSTIMPPIGSAHGNSTILANALQTQLAPPPLLKDAHHSGRPEMLMRGGPPLHSLPPGAGGLHPHHKPELSHLMAGLGGGIPLSLPKGVSLPPHHAGHRMPPGGLAMPPNILGHVPRPSHGPNLGLHSKPGPGPGGVISNAGIAAAVVSRPPNMAQTPPPASPTAGGPVPRMPVGATPPSQAASSERRPGRRKKITPLREDLKRKGAAAAVGAADQPSVPSAAHQEQHQRPPPQHPSLHHGHMARLPPPPPSSSMPPSSTAGLRPPIPPVTTSLSPIRSATAMAAAAAAAAAAAQELAMQVHSRPDGSGSAGTGIHDTPLSVPSSVAHLSYFRSENPLFAHRLGPLPSSILSSSSSSLQRIAAISGAAPPTVFGDPAAYNGAWKPSPPAPAGTKPKSSGGPPPPPGMMVGPPSVGSLEHYHEYNPGNHHYNPYYNVLDRAGHLRPPPTIGELHRSSTLSPTTFTTLQPLEFPHVLKPSGENHHHQPPQLHQQHHHHSATPSPVASSTGGDDGPGADRTAGPPPPPPPAHASSASTTTGSENHPIPVDAASAAAAAAPSPPSPASDSTASGAGTAAPSLVPPSASASTPAASSSSASTSVFGELVSYFSSQQDDLDS